MRVEIIQGGSVLRTHHHNGQGYIEAPPSGSGSYEIRLTNDSSNRKMAVLSVDGIDTIDGKDAGFSGPGYVLNPWESITVKGWLRSNAEAAAFTFAAIEGSYAAQTGRGQKNVGVIGVAVFDERVRAPAPVVYTKRVVVVPQPVVYTKRVVVVPQPVFVPYPWWNITWCELDSTQQQSINEQTLGAQFSCSTADSGKATMDSVETYVGTTHMSLDIGTGYGEKVVMHTSTIHFEKASQHPSTVISFRYATKEKLKEWGVPVEVPAPSGTPNPFPSAPGYAPSPPGWVG